MTFSMEWKDNIEPGADLPRTWSLEGGPTGTAWNWYSAQGDILLHLNPRPEQGEVLVMNNRAGGAWQQEERINYAAAKLPNGKFAFTVRVDTSGFHVSTRGGQKLWLFRHRWQTPWRIFSYVHGYGRVTTVETTQGYGRVGLFADGVEVYTTPILAPHTLSAFSDTLQLPAGVEDFEWRYGVGGGRGHSIQIKNFAWSWLPPLNTSACSKNYAPTCPDQWEVLDLNLDRENRRCKAPTSYSGQCNHISSFSGYSAEGKGHWSLICQADWPCLA